MADFVNRQPSSWTLLWEVPLSVLSWLFFKLNKRLIGFLYQKYLDRNLDREVTWRILSQATIDIPIGLPVLMTKGPRWNTHGYIGTLGPFRVDSILAVETAIAQKSAASWTVVVYRYPDFKTWTQLSWLKSEHQQDWTEISLPKGRYSLGIRYYGLQDDGLQNSAQMPTIKIDRERVIPGTAIAPDANQFYQTLSARTNVYYRALHFYIFTLLRLREQLSKDWVRREYLPVGDPDTTFFYDYFLKGDALKIQINPERLRDYSVYLSVYNRASLPIFSEVVAAPDYRTPELSCDGFYLFRVRPKSANTASFENQDLECLRISGV